MKIGNKESEHLKATIKSQDKEINKLSKENAALNKMIAKMKDTTNSTNQSSDVPAEKSHEERLHDIKKVPVDPKKKRGRSKRQPMHTVSCAETNNPSDGIGNFHGN